MSFLDHYEGIFFSAKSTSNFPVPVKTYSSECKVVLWVWPELFRNHITNRNFRIYDGFIWYYWHHPISVKLDLYRYIPPAEITPERHFINVTLSKIVINLINLLREEGRLFTPELCLFPLKRHEDERNISVNNQLFLYFRLVRISSTFW